MIVTKVTVNEFVPFSQPYFDYIVRHAKSISSNVLSSFNCIKDERVLRERLDAVKRHVRAYKKNNPAGVIFFEDAHYHSLDIRKLCIETLYPEVDIVCMNEEELALTLGMYNRPVDIGDILSCVEGVFFLKNLFNVKNGIIVHTKDYSMYAGVRKQKGPAFGMPDLRVGELPERSVADQVVEGAERRGRARSHGNDDLLISAVGAIARGEYAGDGRRAAAVDDDLAHPRALEHAFQPLGVRHESDLDEHPVHREVMLFAGGAVDVRYAFHLAAAGDFLDLRVLVHRHVRQAVQPVLQHLVRLQFGHELEQRHMRRNARQIDGRLDAGVAAADDRHLLAGEQRTVAVRAIRHALVLELFFARHVQVAPARARRDDDRLALQHGAVVQGDLDEVFLLELLRPNRLHDVNRVFLHMLFKRYGELRALRVLHADQIFDAQRVVHLAAETVGDDAGADPFARGVDRGARTRRTAPDDQDVERLLVREGRRVGGYAELVQNIVERHPAAFEELAVQVDGRHGHDFLALDFFLISGAVDHRVGDAGIQHAHDVERLHDVRTVVAGQADIRLETVLALDGLDPFDHFIVNFRRAPAHLQERQDERSEFMAERNAGEYDAGILARTIDAEARRAGQLRPFDRNTRRHAGQLVQQVQHVSRYAIRTGADLDHNVAFKKLKILLQLCSNVCVQFHDLWRLLRFCLPGRGSASTSGRLLPTSPGRLRPDGSGHIAPP
ncbi:ADP-dependent phosphofructokinase/glucokinase [Thermobacillus xylanilyticus]|uniref:ADP-dependent phosphofructokinase/glucokinase n=1 Tax=Thermobacillus xylanilyticus TaxID=76633 RepID=A0ABM8V6P6_THEXY|nr:ADP-dependent phosphofructokinase/glucokinase [Thermobacillus xylanilyticus]